MYPIITISREFGSGGHSIGEAVAKRLDIPFYDGAIVEKVAEESGYAKDFIETEGEYASRWGLYANTHYANFAPLPQDTMFGIQCKIIKEAAKKGPCVIVGRCADYVLEDTDLNVLDVFIHADTEHRKARILERYPDSDVPIEKRLKKKDKGRATYYKFYTDRQWGDYHNYHLNLDSGYLGEEACVDIICKTAEMKSK